MVEEASRAGLQPARNAPAGRSILSARLAAEWAILEELLRRNPGRLSLPKRHDTVFAFSLLDTPAQCLAADGDHRRTAEHRVRIQFPRHFPALPMEAYLAHPVFHPNVHPETGFLCLWDRHVTTHTVEHAVHKIAAMLGWRLLTTAALHVMQPAAVEVADDPIRLAGMRATLAAAPLHGNDHHDGYVFQDLRGLRRRRLS